jgi:hypothetical protein
MVALQAWARIGVRFWKLAGMREARQLTRPSTNEYTRKVLAEVLESSGANILRWPGKPARQLLEGLGCRGGNYLRHNSADVINSCLELCQNESRMTAIIVDSASSDETVDLVRTAAMRV